MFDQAACSCGETDDRLLLSDTFRRKRNHSILRRMHAMVPGELELRKALTLDDLGSPQVVAVICL